jgi:N-acetyl-alpha-D-glucosaminyl L-malate synthase BshA
LSGAGTGTSHAAIGGSPRPLRIAIVCYPTVGGSGILASQLGQQLAARGHEIHFVSYDKPFRLEQVSRLPGPGRIVFHPVAVNKYDLFRYPDYTLPLSVALAEVARERDLDIIHAHYAVPHAVAAYLARQMLGSAGEPGHGAGARPSRPRIVTTLHGTDTTLIGRDPGYQPIIRHALDWSDGVTAVSRFLRDETRGVLAVTRDIRVIHNFFAPVPPSRSRQEMRATLGVENAVVVLHMSNLRSGKRIEDLLRVIAASRHPERVRLLVLAGGDFAPYRPLVAQLGLEARVIVKPPVPDVENYLNAADLALYTSDYESFGLSVLESMFHGHPVLATAAGGVPEVVADGETGYLIAPGDIDTFARRLDRLVEDPEASRAMGERGRARATELFSANRIVGEYLDFYRQVLDGRRDGREA